VDNFPYLPLPTGLSRLAVPSRAWLPDSRKKNRGGTVGELDVFKRKINLTGYATAQGYQIDCKVSSHNSAVLCSEAGDKTMIARG
jgi:hypothetical protein